MRDGRRDIEAGSAGKLFQFRLAYTDPVRLTQNMLAILRKLELPYRKPCVYFLT